MVKTEITKTLETTRRHSARHPFRHAMRCIAVLGCELFSAMSIGHDSIVFCPYFWSRHQEQPRKFRMGAL